MCLTLLNYNIRNCKYFNPIFFIYNSDHVRIYCSASIIHLIVDKLVQIQKKRIKNFMEYEFFIHALSPFTFEKRKVSLLK